MLDLFDSPLIAGLDYRPDVISETEEAALLANLAEIDLAPFRFRDWTGKRKTVTFGWRYDFGDASFAPADALPDWLLSLRDRVAAFAGVTPDEFVHALCARYDPGAGIGWHRDRPLFDQVVGVSLGASAVMRLRQRTPEGFRRVGQPLAPRSAYLLSGEVRHEWEHSIVPGTELRCSITFRTLSDAGREGVQRVS